MVMRQDASTGQMVETKEDDKVATDSDSGQPVIQVKIYAPFKIYFDDAAFSLTAANETGPFDILPKHRNFLCMLVPGELVVKTAVDSKVFNIARALLHVRDNKVTVFVDV